MRGYQMAHADNMVNINIGYSEKNRKIWGKLKTGDTIEFSQKSRKDERVRKTDREKTVKVIFKSKNIMVCKYKNYNVSYCFNDLITRDIDIIKICGEVL